MVEEHLKGLRMNPDNTTDWTDAGATSTPAGTPSMNISQRDRALADCVLDCDYIYEALDRISSDGQAGRCMARLEHDLT